MIIIGCSAALLYYVKSFTPITPGSHVCAQIVWELENAQTYREYDIAIARKDIDDLYVDVDEVSNIIFRFRPESNFCFRHQMARLIINYLHLLCKDKY